MERTDFETRQGVIPLWAPQGAFESDKPFMLIVTGAWAEHDDMIRAPGVLAPDWDAAVMRLPGNGTPWLADSSIPAWAAAVDELIGRVLKGRVVVAVGLSIGALVTLALRAPEVRRIVALEPPLVMSKIWPLRERMYNRWRVAPEEREFLASVFGVEGPGLTRERTWFHLFEGAAPVEVVLGAIPLMPVREETRFPSFVDEPERVWLAQQRGVRVHVFSKVGHNIHVFAAQSLLRLLRVVQEEALADAAP